MTFFENRPLLGYFHIFVYQKYKTQKYGVHALFLVFALKFTQNLKAVPMNLMKFHDYNVLTFCIYQTILLLCISLHVSSMTHDTHVGLLHYIPPFLLAT